MLDIKVNLQSNRSESIVGIAVNSCYKFKIQRGDILPEEIFGSFMQPMLLNF